MPVSPLRREILKLPLSAAAVWLMPPLAHAWERQLRADVLVIGAGAAWCGAARRLTEAGAHVAVLDARERISAHPCFSDEATSLDNSSTAHGASMSSWRAAREVAA